MHSLAKHLCLIGLFYGAFPSIANAQSDGQESPLIAAPDREKAEIARRIVELGFPEENREAIFFGTIDQMTMQLREASLQAYGIEDEGVIAVFDEWSADYIAESKEVLRDHIPTLMDAMARSYAAIFTLQELRDVAAFVATPSGQRFLQLSPAVMAEPNFANANQAYMNEVQASAPAWLADLRNRIEQHLAERAEQEKSTAS